MTRHGEGDGDGDGDGEGRATMATLPREPPVNTDVAAVVQGEGARGTEADSSEAALVARAQAGEQRAFRDLVERYQRKVLAVAHGMVGDREAAFDLTQDAFLKAYTSIRGFRAGAGFYTWLYRIVVNCCLDHLRREGRARRAGLGAAGPEDGATAPRVDGHVPPPDASVRSQEVRRALIQALDELPEEQKAVLLLREVEGLSYKEIASVMRCSKGTVMSRLHYARHKLRARLRDVR